GDGNASARLLSESIYLREPQTRTLSDVLGGEERIEHPPNDLRRYSDTGIRHAQSHESAGRVVLDWLRNIVTGDRDRASRGHCVHDLLLLRSRRITLEHLDAAREYGKQVVEVVGDPARELPKGFQSLRVPQRLLRLTQPFLVVQSFGYIVDELVGTDLPAHGV